MRGSEAVYSRLVELPEANGSGVRDGPVGTGVKRDARTLVSGRGLR